MRGVGKAMMGVGGALTAGVTLPIAGAGIAALKMAGDAEAASTRMSVTFGSAEDDMMRFLAGLQETTPAAMHELQGAASDAQGALITLGVEQDQANQMTKEALEVASNLSAHMDIPFAEALDKVRKGYAGNTEGLRDMAYNINQAEINAKALEMGLTAEGEAADGAARAQAVHALVMEQSTEIMGAAEANADTFNFQLRRLWASIKDLGAEMGALLLPVLRPLVGLLGAAVERFANAPKWVQYTVLAFAGLAAITGPVLLGLGGLIWAIGTISIALAPGGALAVGLPFVTGLFGTLATVLTTTVIPTLYRVGVAWLAALGPIGLVIAGVAAVAGAAYLIYRNWGPITNFFSGIFSGIRDQLSGWGAAFVGWWQNLPGRLASGLWAGLQAAPVFGPLISLVKGVLEWLSGNRPGFLTEAKNWILSMASGIITGIYEASPVKPIVDLFKWVVDGVKSVLGISSTSSVFHWIGEMIVWGAIEGIYATAGKLWDAVKDVFGGVADWAKDLLGIHSLSTVGRWIGQMFGLGAALGVEESAERMRAAASRMAPDMIRPPRIGGSGALSGAGSSGPRRRGPRRRRPIVMQVEVGGQRFEQAISGAAYEQLRKEIIAMESY